MILPKAAAQYDADNEQQTRALIEQADAQNIKKTLVDKTTIGLNSSGRLSVIAPQSASVQSASPTGNVSTTEKAMGLGASFTLTPATTGTVFVLISGQVFNSTAAGDGVTMRGRYGTGTAPSNGATTGLGTQFSIDQRFVASTAAGKQGFSVHAILTGLTVGTGYWFDLSIVAATAGGASVQDVQTSTFELR